MQKKTVLGIVAGLLILLAIVIAVWTLGGSRPPVEQIVPPPENTGPLPPKSMADKR